MSNLGISGTPTPSDKVPVGSAGTTPEQPVETPTPEAPAPEVEAPETPDTPETEAPEAPEDESFTDVDQESLPDDVKARYGQMQADYTRKTQALAARNAELDEAVSFVSDLVDDDGEPNETQLAVFRTLAERLGYELEDGEGDEVEGDEPEAGSEGTGAEEPEPEHHDPRLDPILAEREAQAQEAAEQAREEQLDQLETQIEDGFKELAKADGVELDEDELDVLFSQVLSMPESPDGGPDVKAAYAHVNKAWQTRQKRWAASKKAPAIPGEAPAEDAVDFSNEEQRLAYTARAVEAAQRALAGN